MSRRWPDPHTGEFVVDVELGKVPDELGVGWHLDAVRVCLSSETRAVTTTVLRRVLVWTLVRELIETKVKPAYDRDRGARPLAHVITDGAGGSRLMTPDEVASHDKSREAHFDEVAPRLRLDEATERKTGRPRSVTPDFLREVAEIWSSAKVLGDEPRTAVAQRFGAASSTAGRWITKARDAGLLAPSGRARKKKETKS